MGFHSFIRFLAQKAKDDMVHKLFDNKKSRKRGVLFMGRLENSENDLHPPVRLCFLGCLELFHLVLNNHS